MKAFVLPGYRKPLELRDVPEPTIGAHDVLVRVDAAGINVLDEKIRAGEFKQILPYSLPRTVGHDVAGTVVDVGPEVRSIAPGDEVYARVGKDYIGTFAERVAIAEADLALRPTTVTAVEAASLPLVALTAWQALVDKGNLRAGQKVLIHAGSGGVGTIAIQLAKHLGATVTTTASGSNAQFLRDLGADVVIDYRSEDFEDGDHDFDLVLDSLGGENLEKSLRVLKPGGIAVGIAVPPDPAFAREAGLNLLVRTVIGVLSRRIRKQADKLGVTYTFLFMHSDGERLRRIAALIDDGTIRPVVGATSPFEQTPDALASLGTSSVRGKTVITLPHHETSEPA
ncbi:NADPH:quinone oxidoreductase [Rhodococcus sp. Leaf7]|uniref:NADP-dependent oxidoreductase n=1 Tax=unclassified Rhodococcus (in: high G+C Gram-positive bacteria) TaxID=192944 RepID=UPI0006FF12B0|nr:MULTISPECIES: NADP-dependent oxidoreductase [unclassified Rhodococcus (in: high G+C Gram-positive bacteria)]KQU06998.1 NADPH:quinone oxidoreductase [Rhodococcus sp. Leaf7]KQU42516.1 NADPH:quinone oxidoreductase [Rhodococcus sp. Leaf247]